MSAIRDKVSSVLGVRIQDDRWEAYVEMLDREGKFTRKTMLGIIMALCRVVEKLEQEAGERPTIRTIPIEPRPVVPPSTFPVPTMESVKQRRIAQMAKARAVRMENARKRREAEKPVQPSQD